MYKSHLEQNNYVYLFKFLKALFSTTDSDEANQSVRGLKTDICEPQI